VKLQLIKNLKILLHIWLYGDHYKWRAMRTNGIDEKYCTGDASDHEKFMSWAETVPHTLRNPLYHWTHMELKNPFGITDTLLNSQSALKIWEHCNTLLQRDDFSTRGLLKQFNVNVLCTTDDPTDSLEHHKKLREDNFEIKVFPAFRPDKGMAVEDLKTFKHMV
jgi:glucuronate isomerase